MVGEDPVLEQRRRVRRERRQPPEVSRDAVDQRAGLAARVLQDLVAPRVDARRVETGDRVVEVREELRLAEERDARRDRARVVAWDVQAEAADGLRLVLAGHVVPPGHRGHLRDARLGIDVEVELDLVDRLEVGRPVPRVDLQVDRGEAGVLPVEVEHRDVERLAAGQLGEALAQHLWIDAVVQPERLERPVPEGHRQPLRDRRQQVP